MSAATKWLLAIVGLLACNVIAMVTLATVANTGGAQVIPDYDVKARQFDAELARDADSRRLGWQAAITVDGDALAARVYDVTGQPITGARVAVTGYHRAHASAPIDVVLAPAGDAYRGPIVGRRGWYDFVIAVDARGAHFTQRLAIEAP